MVKAWGMVWTLALLQHHYLYDGCVYRGLQNREPWGPELDSVTWWGTASYGGNNVRGKVQHNAQVLSLDTAPRGLPEWYNWSISNRSKEKQQLPCKGKVYHIPYCLFEIFEIRELHVLGYWVGNAHKWKQRNNGCCLVAKSCLTLCDPTDCSTPGFFVLHYLLELAQTRVRWVSDAIQPSHALLPPLPFAFNLSWHQGLFQWGF